MKRSRFYYDPPYPVTKTVIFDGTAGLGQAGTVAYFTVTGKVLIAFITPYCKGSLTQSAPTATIALGVTGNTTLICSAMNSEDLDLNEFWDANGGASQGVANGLLLDIAQKDLTITDDILVTVGGAQDVTGGELEIVLYWVPLSSDANVVAA